MEGESQSNVEAAVKQFEQAIAAGVLPAGVPIPSERALSHRFRVTRAAIRVAKIRLIERGMLVLHHRRLFPGRVTQRDAPPQLPKERWKFYRQLLGARRVIWSELARGAARRRRPKEMEALDNALTSYEVTVRMSFLSEDLAQATAAFGMALSRASGNAVLARMQSDVMKALLTGHELWDALRHLPRDRVHGQLTEAVLAGKRAEAARVARRDFQKFDAEWLEFSFRSALAQLPRR